MWNGWLHCCTRAAPSHSSFRAQQQHPAPLRSWAVAEAVCPKGPPKLPKHTVRHWKKKKKKKKWIPNSAVQLAGNPRPDLQLIQTGLIPQTSLEILDLQQHRGAVPVFPSLAGKSMCFFSESRPSLRSKLSTVLIKETSQQQFNSIKFHVFSFKSLK